MVERRVPRWSEFSELVRPRRLPGDATDRRLAKAATVPDLRESPAGTVPRAVFDYTDGAAGAEISYRRTREAFERVEFCPRVLRDVSAVDPSTTLLGSPSALPLVFAPTGFTRLMHTAGEPAVARVAERAGIPYALSTMGTTSLEALAAAAPGRCGAGSSSTCGATGRRASELVARARAAGYEALVLTVDTPVAGPRLRDVRNGFTIPPALTLRTVANAAAAPAVVGRPAHHRAAAVRLAELVGRHDRRAGRQGVRAGRDPRRRRRAARALARQAGGQGRAGRRRRARGGRRRAPTPSW